MKKKSRGKTVDERKFSAAEKKLLQSKTPMAYIDNSLKCEMSSGRKAAITRIWLEKTGYTGDEIKHARNRHPYWKEKKLRGAPLRNEMRSSEHDYSDGTKLEWDVDMIRAFISANEKNGAGRYVHKGWELAKRFETTIPGIQHMRRKYNMAVKIAEKRFGRVTEKRIMDYLKLSENILRRESKKRK